MSSATGVPAPSGGVRLRLLGPLFLWELTRSCRRGRWFLLRFLHGLALCGLAGVFYLLWYIAGQVPHGGRQLTAVVREGFSCTLLGVEFFLAILLTPLATAGVIAEEKERRTLEFLLATDLRNSELVLGKLAARFVLLVLLLLPSLPMFSLALTLGGIEPDLLLAGLVLLALTMLSVASVAILCSVYARRLATAVILAYLVLFGYFGLSSAGLGLYEMLTDRDVIQVVQFVGLDPMVLRAWVLKITEVVGAGNFVVFFHRLALGWRPGVPLIAILPGLLRDYAVFHLLVSLLCGGWAVARVRVVARLQAEGEARRERWWVRLWRWGSRRGITNRSAAGFTLGRRRPPVSERPVLWKEAYVGGLRVPFARFAKILLLVALILPSLAACGLLFAGPGYQRSFGFNRSELLLFLNAWPRGVIAALGSLALLGIALRAAAAVSGERSRQTLEALLLTALERPTLIHHKALGIILSFRAAVLWMGLVGLAGILTGGLHLLALPLILLAWCVYAVFCATLGLWFSMTCRSTLRAFTWTLLTLVLLTSFHWAMWVIYGAGFLLYGGATDRKLELLTALHGGLTPPGVLFLFGFQMIAPATWREQEIDYHAWRVMGVCLVGLALWGYGAWYLWRKTATRFTLLTAAEGEEAAPAPDVRRFRFRRVLRFAAWGFVLGALLLLAGGYASRIVGEWKVAEAIAEADQWDPGWQLDDLEARRAVVPEEENAALDVLAMAHDLPADWAPQKAVPRPNRPGNSSLIDIIRQLPPATQLTAEHIRDLDTAFQQTSPVLERAALLARRTQGRFPVDWSRPSPMVEPPHITALQRVSSYLAVAAAWRVQAGQVDEALELTHALLNAARAPGDEPALTAQITRSFLSAYAVRTLERVLGQGEPSPARLAVLQQLLEEEAAQPLLLTAARGERAQLHAHLLAVERGELSLADLLRVRSIEDYVMSGMWRLSGRYAHGESLALMNRLVETSRRSIPWHSEQRRDLHEDYHASSVLGQMLVRFSFFRAQDFEWNTATLRCAAVALACERYRRAEGTWPPQLENLVPQYLAAVPTDPFDGRSVRYRQLADGVVIYSLGQDGVDNKGKINRAINLYWRSSFWGTDEGFRLWNPMSRRQPPTNPKNAPRSKNDPDDD